MNEDTSSESDEFDEIIETARDYYWDDETQSTVAQNQTQTDQHTMHQQVDIAMEEDQKLTNCQVYNPLDIKNTDWSWSL